MDSIPNKIPHVGVGVLIEKDGKVLLMKRINSHGAGTWSSPGGHLEYRETPEDCAVREVMEETNVTVGNLRFRGITNDLFEVEEKHYITIWMQADYLSGEAVIHAENELTEVGWFPWGNLPHPLFLPLRNLLAGNCYLSDLSKLPNRD